MIYTINSALINFKKDISKKTVGTGKNNYIVEETDKKRKLLQ